MAEQAATEAENIDQPVSDTSLASRLLQELESRRSRLLAEAILAVIRAQVESQPLALQVRFDGLSMIALLLNVLDLFHRDQPRHVWLQSLGESFLAMAEAETLRAEPAMKEPV